MLVGSFLKSAGVAPMIFENSRACRAPGSIELGNSWQGCRCTPARIARRSSAANSSGSCVHPRPDSVQLVCELSRLPVVRAAVHLDGRVLPGKLEACGALQIDGAPLRLGQQPLAHEDHRAVLERRDARPLERRLLEEGVANVDGGRLRHPRHVPLGRPVGEHRALEPPLLHPPVRHDAADDVLRDHAVDLGVRQQQRDLLVAHDRAHQLPDAVDLVEKDGHRKDEDRPRLVDNLGAVAADE
eukprot:2234820-Prymnesium_polylepis.2